MTDPSRCSISSLVNAAVAEQQSRVFDPSHASPELEMLRISTPPPEIGSKRQFVEMAEGRSPSPRMSSPSLEEKSCNCKNSRCLKLYCDCFANGRLCKNCSCRNCENVKGNEKVIEEAKQVVLERDPGAFRPKIVADGSRHRKGCNCRKSHCLKRYCECYQANVACNANCRCLNCRNTSNMAGSTSSSSPSTSPGMVVTGFSPSKRRRGSPADPMDVSQVYYSTSPDPYAYRPMSAPATTELPRFYPPAIDSHDEMLASMKKTVSVVSSAGSPRLVLTPPPMLSRMERPRPMPRFGTPRREVRSEPPPRAIKPLCPPAAVQPAFEGSATSSVGGIFRAQGAFRSVRDERRTVKREMMETEEPSG